MDKRNLQLIDAIIKDNLDINKIDEELIDLIYLLKKDVLIKKLKLKDKDHLIFQNPRILQWIVKKGDKGLQTFEKWRSIYFKEDFLKGAIPKLKVQKINSSLGYGLFAHEDLSKGCYLGEYTGVVRTQEKKDKKNPFLVLYPVKYKFFQTLVIDGLTFGNYTRFINHSKEPNAQMFSITWNQIPRMIFTTSKRIPNGSQIMIDYGKLFWKQLKKVPDVF